MEKIELKYPKIGARILSILSEIEEFFFVCDNPGISPKVMCSIEELILNNLIKKTNSGNYFRTRKGKELIEEEKDESMPMPFCFVEARRKNEEEEKKIDEIADEEIEKVVAEEIERLKKEEKELKKEEKEIKKRIEDGTELAKKHENTKRWIKDIEKVE